MLATLGFAFLAGLFSTLSPCVLPLLPIVLGAAASEHRLGPIALALGLDLSFTVIGLFVATVGFVVGLDADVFRLAGAGLAVMIGLVLVVPRLQTQFSLASGPVANWADQRFGRFNTSGLSGQFGVGLLLGVVWSPCVGPTLGAASLLAAHGQDLTKVAATMLVFGTGAAAPLIVLGMLSRELMIRSRGRLMATGHMAKILMGTVLVLVGVLILSGFDKMLEAWVVDGSPAWFVDMTTRF